MISFTEDQATALVTDAGTLKRGRELAAPAKWSSLGRTDTAAWGACAGSGATPYLTGIDLTEPAFKCSCPSRVFPCKHGAALLLLLARQPELLPPADAAHLARRVARQAPTKSSRSKPIKLIPTPRPPPGTATDQPAALRQSPAQARGAAAGAHGCRRRGAGNLAARPGAPGLGRLASPAPQLLGKLRRPGWWITNCPAWQQYCASWPLTPARARLGHRLLGRLGELYLLLRAWANRDALPPAARQEMAQQVGITLKKTSCWLTPPPWSLPIPGSCWASTPGPKTA